jgi:GrpB-like predicted nucleotidyltransferase (UPF0157 family)
MQRPEILLGLASGTVRVVPYDPAWPDLYSAEAGRITAVLRRNGLDIALEHTGSTAVPGLAAKPVLDILAARTTAVPREVAISAIKTAGYQYRGDQGIEDRDFFRRGDPRQYHLHLTLDGSSFWHDHRAFRDYLRTHPETASEYARLKLDLAARFPNDRESYIEGKTAFVRAVLAVASAV